MATIILGGGIIGLSTAFYLSQLEPDLAANRQIHIIDSASSLLLSASAYAGGFLAESWFNPASSSLGALSFRLHAELASRHDGATKWSYMPSKAYSLSTRALNKNWLEDGTSRADAAPQEMLHSDGTPAWFTKQPGGSLEMIDDGCAQINPKQLCEFLIKECESAGVRIHTSCEAVELHKNDEGKICGIKIRKDTEIFEKHCSNIVICAGAWTPNVFKKLFPMSKMKIPITQLAGYSIVVRSPRYSKPILSQTNENQSHAIYATSFSDWQFSPEAFSRISDGKPEIWVGGLNDSELALPHTADGVKGLIDVEKSGELKQAVVKMACQSAHGDDLNSHDLEIVREGLCFRPVSKQGIPILMKVKESTLGVQFQDGDVFIASGHGPWGISLSLGTGLVMAEMMTKRKFSADVSELQV